MKLIRSGFVAICFCVLLQSCWVWQMHKEWNGAAYSPKSAAEHRNFKDVQFMTNSSVECKSVFIPLPFLLIGFDVSKKYKLEFICRSFNKSYKDIDSIRFQLYNHDSLLLSGTVTDTLKKRHFFKQFDSMLPKVYNHDTMYEAFMKSKYIYHLNLQKSSGLKIHSIVYGKDKNNIPFKINLDTPGMLLNRMGFGFFM